jgi:HEAT repeat protein
MPIIADTIRAVLLPFLLVTGGLLLLLVGYIVILHSTGEVAFRRRQRLLGLYRPLVDATLSGDGDALDRLTASPARHRAIVSALLLEPLRVTGGQATTRARAAAEALGLIDQWTDQLDDRRWWTRAEAARALGLVKCADVVPALAAALDDPFDEVRAGAVESLGLIADPRAIPDLIARLADQSRHQRVRLVHALQQFGAAAVLPLIEHGQAQPADRAAVAEILGSIGAAGALDQLIAWSSDERADVRAAIWQAVGTIGVDDRAYYHVLRALNDSADTVRAAAAWALGRSGRQDAATYLAGRLDDEWLVAAQTARALRALGPAGRRELEAAATTRNSELARQMLWESGAAAAV